MCIRYMYVVLVLLSIGLHFLWVYRPDNPIGMLGGQIIHLWLMGFQKTT